MVRPKHNQPEDFTTLEVVEATGFDKRTVQLIRDRAAGPYEDVGVLTRARTLGLHDEDTVAELSMAAGVHLAGFPLMQALAIVRAYFAEHVDYRPAQLANVHRLEDPRRSRHDSTWLEAVWLTREARGGEDSGLPMEGDVVLIVADREFVLDTRHAPRMQDFVQDGIDPKLGHPLCRVLDMKGGEAEIEPVWRGFEAGPSNDFREAYEVYHEALQRAVGVARVNFSLAIRNGFDRVQDRRKRRGGPFFPSTADKHDEGATT